MSKHSNNPSKAMKRGPMGMHGGHGPAEKAKDFKGTMMRLIALSETLSFEYRCFICLFYLFGRLYGRRT